MNLGLEREYLRFSLNFNLKTGGEKSLKTMRLSFISSLRFFSLWREVIPKIRIALSHRLPEGQQYASHPVKHLSGVYAIRSPSASRISSLSPSNICRNVNSGQGTVAHIDHAPHRQAHSCCFTDKLPLPDKSTSTFKKRHKQNSAPDSISQRQHSSVETWVKSVQSTLRPRWYSTDSAEAESPSSTSQSAYSSDNPGGEASSSSIGQRGFSTDGPGVEDGSAGTAQRRFSTDNPWVEANPSNAAQRRYSTDNSVVELSETDQEFYRVLNAFPGGMQMAFAYGSGVFQQQNHPNPRQNMLDFCFVVDDPQAWHSQNLEMNSGHYSSLKYYGPRALAFVQELGAGVYYNTLVRVADRLIKYGVISTDRLVTDLLDWDPFYISGRLHKPVHLLIPPSNPELKQALRINMESAVHCALLLMPEEFDEEQLYVTIAGLSYNGDFRMVVGEDRNKVINIVKPNMQRFKELYRPILKTEKHIHWQQTEKESRLEQDPNHVTQFHHLQLLPKNVLMLLQEDRTRPGSHPDLEEVLRIYANSSHCDDSVAHCIYRIVRWSSTLQTLKSSLTAGVKKSVHYSYRKIYKMWDTMKRD